MITAFTNAIFLTAKERITGKALLVENNIVKSFVETNDIPPDARLIDVHQNYISPGLIDLQIYGSGEYLFSNSPTVDAFKSITENIIATGTTSFLLTLATSSLKVIYKALSVVNENPHPSMPGLHLEGPYINPKKKGAHRLSNIRLPELNEIKNLIKHANGALKMITVAPELLTKEMIELFVENNIIVSAGHSSGTFQEATIGFENGITATTHLFNAMSPLHHRETGLPGATFLTKNIYASIIADGIHVDFNTLKIAKEIMKQRLFLITDAVTECRQGAFIYIKQKDRYTLPDGTLSGSSLTLLQAVKNCVEHAGIPLDEAIRMASTYPASIIHANDVGKIEPGCKANLIMFSKEFVVQNVFNEGKFLINKQLA